VKARRYIATNAATLKRKSRSHRSVPSICPMHARDLSDRLRISQHHHPHHHHHHHHHHRHPPPPPPYLCHHHRHHHHHYSQHHHHTTKLLFISTTTTSPARGRFANSRHIRWSRRCSRARASRGRAASVAACSGDGGSPARAMITCYGLSTVEVIVYDVRVSVMHVGWQKLCPKA
jgi:hypothetical protein